MFATLLQFCLSHLLYFALHLENGTSFPKPLNAKKEAEYFQAMTQGDAQARNLLIEHNLRLVAHVIKKYYTTNEEQEDMISIGTIGLIKAVSTFKSEKGTRFATYASRCIENEILMHFRGQKKNNCDVYINDPIETDKDGNPLTLSEIVADDMDIEERIDQKIKVENMQTILCSALTKREQVIICMRYGLNGNIPHTQREIAGQLHISRSYVSRIEKKALEKLRASLENN